MSLVIRNLQRVIPVRRAPLRKNMEIVRTILGVQKFDMGIICVDNKNIQHLNRLYRKKNVPTDVLSFPFHEMYGQEKLVLEELSRHTGTGLQPLSRGLY
uniref:endoribonuclease YbeY-like isoform X1 n=1 Tax=Jaculus jaculus TaxID=51337 RepID=UPI001E1B009D|nr:endoribonuclease YbeY-like isoform X1 [Jaculus jaculus]